MRFLLLATVMSAQELRRVDDAASGGAVIALNSTADDRPVWADGRLAVAVAAAAVAAQLRDAEARLAQAERAGTSAKAERDERAAALAAKRALLKRDSVAALR